MMINLSLGALILAIWVVTLFFGKTIGLSMLLFITPFVYFLTYMLEKHNKIKNSKSRILLIPILLLSSTYFIYDNAFFNSLNKLIIPTLISFMVLSAIGEKFEINLEIVGKILGSFFTPISYIGESIMKLTDSIGEKLKIDTNSEKEYKHKKIVKGIMITFPIVLVIIILLSSADEVFANIFTGLFDSIFKMLSIINISTTFVKIVCIGLSFLYFMGLFYYIFVKYEFIEETAFIRERKYDNYTIKMILIALNVVYLLFCYIQIKSLFMRNVNINYSHYARQGFFQLMIVSLINLVTILIAKKRENKEEESSNKFINYMCLLMIAFTFIIVVSATIRMYFYENAYGYTLLRLLVYCVLFTESILFIPTILYINDKKVDLPKCYFAIIICIYLLMNFANFDNIIAKRNVNRYNDTGKIDMNYLYNETGTDAINQILKILETSTDVDNCKEQTRIYLKRVYTELNEEKTDFRDFNLSKIFAKNLIGKELKLNEN